MITFITYTAWFALGTLFGVVCTLAFVESANAQSVEDICKDLEDS